MQDKPEKHLCHICEILISLSYQHESSRVEVVAAEFDQISNLCSRQYILSIYIQINVFNSIESSPKWSCHIIYTIYIYFHHNLTLFFLLLLY